MDIYHIVIVMDGMCRWKGEVSLIEDPNLNLQLSKSEDFKPKNFRASIFPGRWQNFDAPRLMA